MIRLEELIKVTNGKFLQEGKGISFTKASIDTRTLSPGELFFAVTGKNLDGHSFLEQAISSGASGVVVSQACELPKNITVILVEDTTKALAKLAALVRIEKNPKVVSVTGSVGKTTTKEIIAHLLSQNFSTLKSAASFNNQFGVPLTLLSLEEKHTHAVVEVGTNHIGEIAPLAEIIQPDVAVITNIGYAHIANFGSREAIAEEKTQLFSKIREGGVAIINGDDPYLRAVVPSLEQRGLKVISAGVSSSCTVCALNITATEAGTSGVIRGYGWEYPFSLKMPGEHFVQSAVLAVAAVTFLGMSPKIAVDALETFILPAGRLNTIQVNPLTLIIDDTYNASPDAVLSAVKTLSIFSANKKLAILGEMRELGDFSKICHEDVGRATATSATDILTVGEDAKFIQKGAIDAGFSPKRIYTAKTALDALDKAQEIIASENTSVAVLVKGSRFTHMERVVLGLSGSQVKCARWPCSLYINCKTCPALTTG